MNITRTSLRCMVVAMVLCTTTQLDAQDMPLSQIIIPGEGWNKVEGKFKPIRYLTSNTATVVEVYDQESQLQAKIDVGMMKVEPAINDGKLSPDSLGKVGTTHNLVLDRTKRVVQWVDNQNVSTDGKEHKLPLQEVTAGWRSFDGGTLFLGDAASKYVWAYRVDEKGLSAGEKYMTLRVAKGETRSETSDIRTDSAGRIYVATKEGIQIFDPTGRLCGVLLHPSKERAISIVFSGEQSNLLFAACGNEIYFRKMLAKGRMPSTERKP